MKYMKNYFDMTGRVAIVSGASSGIGVEYARALASQGAKVAIFARRYEKLQEVAKMLEEEIPGSSILPVKCDVTVENEVITAVGKVVETFGKIDILFNNAGIVDATPLHLLEEAQWDKVIDTDLKSVFLVSKHVLPHMMEANYGRIINTASMLGAVGSVNVATHSYNAAKSALVNLTRAMGAFYGKYGITVNAIGPSLFYSEMTKDNLFTEPFLTYYKKTCPLGRPGELFELDGAVLYFASEISSYTTGQILYIDGGWTSI
jgi:NAD(P)-dependent dehydrogenase (short-subunit alcohol dehydrogenase family)